VFGLGPSPHLHPESLPVTTVPYVWPTPLPTQHYKSPPHPQRLDRHNSEINHKEQGQRARESKVSGLYAL